MRFLGLFASTFAAATMFSRISQAEHWEMLTENDDFQLAIETQGIGPYVPHNSTPSGIRNGDIAYLYRKEKQAPDGAIFKSMRAKAYVNCDDFTYDVPNMNFYSGKFEKIVSRLGGPSEFQPVTKGTATDKIYRYLCAPVVCASTSFGMQCNNTWREFRR